MSLSGTLAAACVARTFEYQGPDGGTASDAQVLDATVSDAAPSDGPSLDACVSQCLDPDTLFNCVTMSTQACPMGCDPTGGDHCLGIAPSNDPDADAHLVGATTDLFVPYTGLALPAWSLFTDTGEIRDEMGAAVRSPGTGVVGGIGYYQSGNIGIFAMASLTIDDGAQLWVFGERALLILSAGDVDIHGVIDASAGICADGVTANRSCPGPGGGFGAGGGVSTDVNDHATGCAPGANGHDAGGDLTGGGGGGLGMGTLGVGGNGGDGDGTFGGIGGFPGGGCPNIDLIPLVGGSGGGWGGGPTGGRGGGGGGAVQISSYTQITMTGLMRPTVGIWVGGAGGGLGADDMGGGGGGAGGAILLEAFTITVDAPSWLAANGGGGGGGNFGSAGNKGTFSDVPAAGGVGGIQGAFSADGGDGAAGVTPAENGSATDDRKGTGGGGGGIGICRINADVHTGATTSSPAVTFGPTPIK